MRPSPQSANPSRFSQVPAQWAVGAVILFISAATLRIVLSFRHIPLGQSWLDTALLVIGTAATLIALSRRLPLQNSITIAVLTWILSSAFEWVFANGRHILPPWVLPIVWVICLTNARGTVQWFLQPWKQSWGYGFWLIGITGVLASATITGLSILSSQAEAEPSQFVSFLLRAVVAVFILAVNTTWFIRKNPVPMPFEKSHLWIWMFICLVGLVEAASQDQWLFFGAGLLLNLTIIGLIVSQHRSADSSPRA